MQAVAVAVAAAAIKAAKRSWRRTRLTILLENVHDRPGGGDRRDYQS